LQSPMSYYARSYIRRSRTGIDGLHASIYWTMRISLYSRIHDTHTLDASFFLSLLLRVVFDDLTTFQATNIYPVWALGDTHPSEDLAERETVFNALFLAPLDSYLLGEDGPFSH
jgi:hypothetical protein